MEELDASLDALTVNRFVIAGLSCTDEEYGTLGHPEHGHARTKSWFPEPYCSGLAILDIDAYGLATTEAVRELLLSICPTIRGVAMLIRPSSSNGVCSPDGTPYKSASWHVIIAVAQGDRVDLLERIYAAAARAGYASIMIGDVGQRLPRNLIDTAMLGSNQPLYASRPLVEPPLIHRRPKSLVIEGRVCRASDLPEGSLESVKPLYNAMKTSPETLAAQLRHRLVTAKAKVKAGPKIKTFREAKITLKRAIDEVADQVARNERGVLGPHDEIVLYPSREVVTGAQIWADLKRFNKQVTYTPGEPQYRNWAQTGIIYTDGPVPKLACKAHGSKTYTILQFKPENLLATRPRLLTAVEGDGKLRAATANWPNSSRVAIRATMGLGKTGAAVERMAEMTESVLYLTPTGDLAKEVYARYLATGTRDGFLWKGRFANRTENELMCLEPDLVAHVIAASKSDEILIQKNACSGCRSRSLCGYQEQVRYAKADPPRVIFATHDFAHSHFPNGWEPDAVIIDEVLRNGGIDTARKLTGITPEIASDKDALATLLKAHHLSFPDLSLGIEAVEKWTRTGEALEALIAKEPYYIDKGECVVPRVKDYLYPDLPLLILDGTFRQPLAELQFGVFDDVVQIDVKRNVVVVQVVGMEPTKHRCRTDSKLLGRLISVFERVPTGWLIVTYKGAVEKFGLKDRENVGWFGGVRGKDVWSDCDGVLEVGRNQPPTEILECLANVMLKPQGKVITFLGDGKHFENVTITSRQGQVKRVKLRLHRDPIVRELMRAAREDEAIQVIDRIRSVWHRGPPKIVVIIAGAVPIDVDVDMLVDWSDFKEGRLTSRIVHATLTGPVGSTPGLTARLRPELFSNRDAARASHDAHLRPDWLTYFERELIPGPGTPIYKCERPIDCVYSKDYRTIMGLVFRNV